MLSTIVAHVTGPLSPHDLWVAWNLHPVALIGLVVPAWVYRRGARSGREEAAWRARCFFGALVAAAVVVSSPLHALSGVLASAHMVQHVVLVLAVSPLLAASAPSATLLRGSPAALRRALGRWERPLAPGRVLNHPASVWLLHAATLWFWHASGPYDAALDSELLHLLEHTSFVVTGFLFWRVVIGARESERVSSGLGVLLVFGMALQSVFLSALLTFASAPWYAYSPTAVRQWGLDPLADQQLAGLIMWVPAGILYVAIALALLAAWIRSSEREGLPA